jgi:ABC-type branched-subunit amino acid transport system permease subunit
VLRADPPERLDALRGQRDERAAGVARVTGTVDEAAPLESFDEPADARLAEQQLRREVADTRTPLGLLMRAVMQNRNMASCMGVRTERVNMLTFGLGSGLAGLAGAFLSQIGNVGPSMGQNYIVDCFMTVVVGGVGNLPGTVISAFGIGLTDQALQQILLDPVIGKILVLLAIILFLQWRPAGLFVTRSRSLED